MKQTTCLWGIIGVLFLLVMLMVYLRNNQNATIDLLQDVVEEQEKEINVVKKSFHIEHEKIDGSFFRKRVIEKSTKEEVRQLQCPTGHYVPILHPRSNYWEIADHIKTFNDRAVGCWTGGGLWRDIKPERMLAMAKSLTKYLRLKEDDTVWESGVGCGHMIGSLREANPNMVLAGCDIADAALNYTSTHLSEGTFCRSDMRNLSYVANDTFDFSFSFGSFSYLPNADAVCQATQELVRITKPLGKIWVGYVKPFPDFDLPALSRLFFVHCLEDIGIQRNNIRTEKLDYSFGFTKGDFFEAASAFSVFIEKPIQSAYAFPIPVKPRSTWFEFSYSFYKKFKKVVNL